MAGHKTIREITVTVDNSNPEAYIVSPTSNEYVSGDHVFKISAKDHVGIKSVKMIMFSTLYNATYNTQSSCYEVVIDTTIWNDGSDFISGIIEDTSGRFTNVGPRYFHIDNYHPEIFINNPVEMAYVEGDVLFDIDVIDNFKDLCTVQYNVDNKGWVDLPLNTSNIGYTKFSGFWNTTQLTDGSHTINIRAKDPADHLTQYEINVIVDNHAPTCEIHTPIENQYMENLVTFRVTATDEVGISLVRMNIFNNYINATFNSQTGYYEYTADSRIILEDGLQSISVVAFDFSNKTAADGPVFFNVDNTDPTLAINSPHSGDYVNQTVYINATTIDAYPLPTEYNVDSQGWHDIGVPWDTTTTSDGEHIIQIRARDAIGHMTVETITVIVDNNFPICTIHNPSQDQFVEDSLTFKVLATDTLGIDRVELTIFPGTPYEKRVDATYNSVSNYYEYTQSLYGILNGIYAVNVTAYDMSHNRVTLDGLDFRVDADNPKLMINEPANGKYYTGDVILNVTAQDSFETSLEFNVDSTGWHTLEDVWRTAGFSDGEHLIEFKATDEAGHVSTQTIAIFIDNTEPLVNIVNPRLDDHLTDINTVKAYCHDALALESVWLTVDTGEPTEIYINPTTGLYEIPIDTIKHPDGAHTIIVTARDYVGHATNKTITVYFNNVGPDFIFPFRILKIRKLVILFVFEFNLFLILFLFFLVGLDRLDDLALHPSLSISQPDQNEYDNCKDY